MTLVGRDEEIVALDGLFRDCARGRGAVAVIRGPVAVGKTSLLQAFADRVLAEGAIFLGAIASPAERGLPLGILDQLCRGSLLPAAIASRVASLMQAGMLTGQLAAPTPRAVSPVLAQVFDGLLALLEELSEGCPVVIAVDDVQHADVASLQCLSYLARRASTARILTVLTEGAHALPADRMLRAEILRQGNCRCIPLALLSPSGVASLLGEHLDSAAAQRLAPTCQALTGGNPLLVKALAEDFRRSADGSPAELIPDTAFCSAVVACLHRYEPALVELAQAVAVLGEDATPGLLGELLAVNPESAARGIDALGASGLLQAGHFRHEQARQAVLDHMTADERAALHGGVARTLYRTGAASATLARHIASAHRIGTRWAVAALQEAAEHALAEGQAERAIDYLRLAESQCANERQRAVIILSLTYAEWPIDPERAAWHLPELVAAARAGLLDRERLGELAYYLLWVGDTGSAAEILTSLGIGSADAASGLAGANGASPPSGSAAHHMMIQSPVDILYPDLARRARQAVREARTSARVTACVRSQEASPLRPAAGSGSQASLAAAERVLAERSLNDPTLVLITTALMTLIGGDMLDRAASWCEQLMREPGASSGGTFWPAVLTAFMAMIETRRGNLTAAEDHARTALCLLSKKAWGVAIGGPLASLLLTATASRKHEAAAAYLRMPVPDAMFGTLYGLLYVYARGEYYLSTGCPQAALDDFTDCGHRMNMWELDLPGLVPWRAKAAEAYLVMGNTPKARELSEGQLAEAGAWFARARGIALRVLALASHPNERAALLRESAELLRDSGARLELAYTLTALSNAYLALGEYNRAHWAARRARNLAERCGVQAPKTAFGEVDIGRESGNSVNGAGTNNGAGTKLLAQLSDAEERVAMLAAYGYTNSQIAGKLYITVSTVEQHLTRVYRKLGVVGRADLPIKIWPSSVSEESCHD